MLPSLLSVMPKEWRRVRIRTHSGLTPTTVFETVLVEAQSKESASPSAR